MEIESGRDREGTFAPKILPKRQLILTSELEEKVTAMYAKGMSTRDISEFIKEMYAMEISATEISHITDKVIPVLKDMFNEVCHFLNSGMFSYALPEQNRELL